MKKRVVICFTILIMMLGCTKKDATEVSIGKNVLEKIEIDSFEFFPSLINSESPYIFYTRFYGEGLEQSIFYRLENDALEIISELDYYMHSIYELKNNQYYLVGIVFDYLEDPFYKEMELYLLDENGDINRVFSSKGENNMIFVFDDREDEVIPYTCELENCAFVYGEAIVPNRYRQQFFTDTTNSNVQILQQWDDNQSFMVLFDLDKMQEIGKRYEIISRAVKDSNRFSDAKTEELIADEELFLTYKNGLYGVIDGQGNERVPLQYKEIGKEYWWGDGPIFISNNYIVAQNKSGKFGVVNPNNEVLIEFQYDDIAWVLAKGERFIAVKNGKYGVLDAQGRILVDFLYDEIVGMNEYEYDYKDYYAVCIDRKVGIVDGRGNIVVPIEYEINDYYEKHTYSTKSSDNNVFSLEFYNDTLYLKIIGRKKIYINQYGVEINYNEVRDLSRGHGVGNYGHYVNCKADSCILMNENGGQVFERNFRYASNHLYIDGALIEYEKMYEGRYISFGLSYEWNGGEVLFDLQEEKAILEADRIRFLTVGDVLWVYEIKDNMITAYNEHFEEMFTIEGKGISLFVDNLYLVRTLEDDYELYRLNLDK